MGSPLDARAEDHAPFGAPCKSAAFAPSAGGVTNAALTTDAYGVTLTVCAGEKRIRPEALSSRRAADRSPRASRCERRRFLGAVEERGGERVVAGLLGARSV